MKILTNRTHYDLKDSENYVLIVVDSELREFKARCLGNVKEYIVVGVMEYNDDFITYTLFQTENLPNLHLTIIRKEISEYDHRLLGETEDISNDYITKQALVRAKDIKYSL